MDTNLIVYAIAIIAGIMAIVLGMYKEKKIAGRNKMWFVIPLLVIGGFLALMQAGLLAGYGIPQLAGLGEQLPFAAAPRTPSQGGVTTVEVKAATGAFPIDTFSLASIKEKHSNSYTAANGTLKFYDDQTNPTSPTASTIDTITISAGAGSSTNKKILTDKPYRVVYDGVGTYYSKDLGIMTFQSKDYNKNTGQYAYDLGEIGKVATIDDILAEIENLDKDVNGAANSSVVSIELGSETTSDQLQYNETAGDGQWYIQPTISFSGANTEVQEPVICFEFDQTNPPEGNEISAFTYQLQSGTDFGLPSDLLDYWSNEECLSLGAVVSGGTSSKIKLTVTYDEANLDTTDDWYLYVDDLGAIKGKDVVLNTAAALDKIKFTAVA